MAAAVLVGVVWLTPLLVVAGLGLFGLRICAGPAQRRGRAGLTVSLGRGLGDVGHTVERSARSGV